MKRQRRGINDLNLSMTWKIMCNGALTIKLVKDNLKTIVFTGLSLSQMLLGKMFPWILSRGYIELNMEHILFQLQWIDTPRWPALWLAKRPLTQYKWLICFLKNQFVYIGCLKQALLIRTQSSSLIFGEPYGSHLIHLFTSLVLAPNSQMGKQRSLIEPCVT